MKRMKHDNIYIKVIAMLLVIAVLGVGVTMLTAPQKSNDPSSEQLHIVASFYPVYITALRLTEGIDDVAVDCLVTSQVGCLHDYQMSPQERTLLESADVVVINGAGAESALVGALSETDARTIELCEGMTLLETAHDHDHGHDHDDEVGVNSHVWVSPKRYAAQVEVLRDRLCELDPERAELYRANAQSYLVQIDAVRERLEKAVALYADVPTVMVHDSLSYLTEDVGFFGVNLDIGENQAADPELLAHATEWLDGAKRALFVYDSQYEAVPYEKLRAIPAEVIELSVDTCVTGAVNADRWLEAMTTFCEELEAAA